MELNREDALVCAKAFADYFGDIGSIEQYMRDEKLKDLKSLPSTLFPIEDDLFSDFSMHPNDMDIDVVEIPDRKSTRLNSSHT